MEATKQTTEEERLGEHILAYCIYCEEPVDMVVEMFRFGRPVFLCKAHGGWWQVCNECDWPLEASSLIKRHRQKMISCLHCKVMDARP